MNIKFQYNDTSYFSKLKGWTEELHQEQIWGKIVCTRLLFQPSRIICGFGGFNWCSFLVRSCSSFWRNEFPWYRIYWPITHERKWLQFYVVISESYKMSVKAGRILSFFVFFIIFRNLPKLVYIMQFPMKLGTPFILLIS